MKRDKVKVYDPDRFRIVNKNKIEKAFKLEEENKKRPKYLHHKLFRSATLRKIFTERFLLTRREVDELVYSVLNEHPEGLNFKQLQFFTGLGKRTLKISLNRLKTKLLRNHNGIFIRKIDNRAVLYYTDKHSRKIAKQIKETEEMYIELENKLKRMENGNN